MKVYIATQLTGGNPKAASSMEGMKFKLRDMPESQWTIKTYQFKTDKASICEIIEGNLGAPESMETVHVTAKGQVRRV